MGQGFKLPWFVLLSTAPIAPPELVPMKVKEPGESQKFRMPKPEENLDTV